MKKDCGDSRSDGLLHIIELLKAVDCIPSYLLLENVEGFEASQSREKLLLALKERGTSTRSSFSLRISFKFRTSATATSLSLDEGNSHLLRRTLLASALASA